MTNSVCFKKVTKKYKIYDNQKEKLKGLFFPERVGDDFYAVQDINFAAEKGDVIGLVGVNGSGKSTLSNLIAGITPPTDGEIKLNGQASLIAINSGLNNQLTGRENIELKCLMLGFSKKEIKELMPAIIEFADIGKFIDQPVKNYSSGMKSRLGFGISVNIDPDILVIDEALSVGDKTFTFKCLEKMNEFKEKGKTIFFVSHSISQIKRFCHKAIWLEAGMIKSYGTIEEVVPKYEDFLKKYTAMSKEEKKNFQQSIEGKRRKSIENMVKHEVSKEIKDYRISKSRNQKRRKQIIKYKLKRYVFSFVLLCVLGMGGFLGYKSIFQNYLHTKNDHQNNILVDVKKNLGSKQEDVYGANKQSDPGEIPDLRYVNVGSAYIRMEHDLDSIALGVAGFGGVYVVEEEYTEGDMKWLRIARPELEGESGWISSKLMTIIKEEVPDDKAIKQLSEALNVDLSNNISLLGKREEEISSEDGTVYLTRNGVISSVTVTINTSSKNEIVEKLGDPHLEKRDTLFYHGSTYDYKIKLGRNNIVESISISKWDSMVALD